MKKSINEVYSNQGYDLESSRNIFNTTHSNSYLNHNQHQTAAIEYDDCNNKGANSSIVNNSNDYDMVIDFK